MTTAPRSSFVGLAVAGLVFTPVANTVAAEVSLTVDEDGTLWIDTVLPTAKEAVLLASDELFEFVNGAVLVSDPAPPQPIGPHPVMDAALGESLSFGDLTSSLTEIQALRLHSNPGADRVIYLDFDGHTIEGTAWNNGRATSIEVGEYSREEVGQEVAGFSQYEIEGIIEIWAQVSEDFAPWPVDVTTEFPGDEALNSSNRNTDQKYGSRVVITPDSSWYGSSGGVAYVGTMGLGYYSPAFVFSNNLPSYAWVDTTLVKYGGNPKMVGEAASHEVGHNLGLSHDGVVDSNPNDSTNTSRAYYGGSSTGDWAPIMGVGYYKPVTQWSKGDYPDASQKQDDIAIIDGFLPGRATESTTSSESLGSDDSIIRGTLADGGAVDTHSIVVNEGPAQITLEKAVPTGNLLADLVVTNDATGQTFTVAPGDAATWIHTVADLDAGSYTVRVRSVGWVDPEVAADGFSDYSSMGDYLLTVDGAGSTAGTTTTTTPATTMPPGGSTTTTDPQTEPPTTVDPGNELTPSPNRLTAITPTRLLDTRTPGATSNRIEAGENIRIPIAGATGVAGDARAAVVNVVAVRPATNGFLSITPCTDVADTERTSSLNFAAGSNVANSTITSLSDDGNICIYASATTDVVLDVTGSIGPSGDAGLTDTTTRRVADSRRGEGLTGRLAPGLTTVLSLDGIVDDATTAVAINITAVHPASTGFLTIDNCNSATSTAALNFATGENRGNNGVFALNADRALCVTSSAAVDVIIDLTGEFGPDGLTYVPAEPARLLDTRLTGTIGAGSSERFTVPQPDSDGVPAAASVNIASARHPRSGFVTSWDCGALATSSALNPVGGQVTANGALIELNSERRSCLFHEAGGDLIVDLNGWWV